MSLARCYSYSPTDEANIWEAAAPLVPADAARALAGIRHRRCPLALGVTQGWPRGADNRRAFQQRRGHC